MTITSWLQSDRYGHYVEQFHFAVRVRLWTAMKIDYFPRSCILVFPRTIIVSDFQPIRGLSRSMIPVQETIGVGATATI